jgi:hypothetical protein
MKIIRNGADLAKYVEINANSKFQFFSPSVRTAERRFLVPVLGNKLYDKLAQALAGSDPLSADLQAVADLAQEAVANLALSMAVTRLAVTMDENGARRNESEKVKSAFQYQEINLRESYIRAGYDALDDLLQVRLSRLEGQQRIPRVPEILHTVRPPVLDVF